MRATSSVGFETKQFHGWAGGYTFFFFELLCLIVCSMTSRNEGLFSVNLWLSPFFALINCQEINGFVRTLQQSQPVFNNFFIIVFPLLLSLTMLRSVHFYWIKIYPMDLMLLLPLFPLVYAPILIPNPIHESHDLHSFSLFARKPSLALAPPQRTLKPPLLQLLCKEAWEPISFFHVLRPSDVARYFPSAINECREAAFLLITMNLICLPIFIPRQILENGVLQ